MKWPVSARHGLALLVVPVVAVAACGSNSTSSSGSSTTSGSAAASGSAASPKSSSGETGPIVYATTKLTDQYTAIMNKLFEQYAKQMGFKVLPTLDSRGDAATQVTQIRTVLGQGVKGIYLTADDAKAIKPGLTLAEAKGVPVVTGDTGPMPGYGKVAVAVRVSGAEMGQQQCALIGKQLKGSGSVLYLQGALTNQAGLQRWQGFDSCMKSKYPNMKVIAKPANFIQEQATQAARAVLSTNKSIKGIVLASDAAYLPGVIAVMQRLKLLKPVGDPGHIALITIDGAPFSLDQVRKGNVDAVISQPMSGFVKYGLEHLKNAMAGKAISAGPTSHDSKIVDTDGLLEDYLAPTLVTKENAGDKTLWGNA